VSLDLGLIAGLLSLGAGGGFLAGLLGIGGGMVLVPFTTVLLEHRGFPPALALKVAIATSLATICFTSMSSVRAHHRRGVVRWPLAAALAPGIVLGSLAGAQLAGALPVRVLAALFAGFLGLMATRMLVGGGSTRQRPLPGRGGLAAVGGAIGLVSAVVGAGGAFMSVPYMSSRRVPIHQAIGTSSALGFPIALAGTLGYVVAGWRLQGLPAHMLGYVYLPALAVLAAASVSTAPAGAWAAHRLDTVQLRRVFAVLLFGIAAYMLARALRG
jgi:uncharacterized membrane protein YfcA